MVRRTGFLSCLGCARGFFQATDVPVLVMCLCWCGAASLASQILEKTCQWLSLERPALTRNTSFKSSDRLTPNFFFILHYNLFQSIFCRQIHLTRDFSHTPCTCDHTHIVAQGVSVRISLHPHAIHDVNMFERAFCLSLVSLPLLPCLFHCLPVLCPAHHLQCRHRRGLKPLHSRRMRSIAPWRCTTLVTGYEPKLLDDFHLTFFCVLERGQAIDCHHALANGWWLGGENQKWLDNFPKNPRIVFFLLDAPP